MITERLDQGLSTKPRLGRGVLSLEKIGIGLFVLIFTLAVLKNGWLYDDAYITFRTVDNFVNGYGLTWNTAERVQTYTHPLWMFLVSTLYFFTHEMFYTAILVCVLVSVATVLIFAFGIAESPMAALLGVTILTFSKAFVDYSTSGLENPLTHLLLGVFLYLYLKFVREEQQQAGLKIATGDRRPVTGEYSGQDSRLWNLTLTGRLGTLFWLSFVAALAALNRMDTILFFLPGLAYVLWRVRRVKGLIAVILGFMPFILWEAFSLFYYGFPFPNTAYAKLNTDVNSLALARQGLYYLLNSWQTDPLTMLVIAAGMAVPFITRRWSNLPIVLGIALYLLYVVRIGGDFMTGRFLTAPLFGAVILLASSGLAGRGSVTGDENGPHPNPLPKGEGTGILPSLSKREGVDTLLSLSKGVETDTFPKGEETNILPSPLGRGVGDEGRLAIFRAAIRSIWLPLFAVVLLVGLISPYPPLVSDVNYGEKFEREELRDQGIQDGRGIYYRYSGLLKALQNRNVEWPDHSWSEKGREARAAGPAVIVRGAIGFFGFYAGPEVHIIDHWALADPLLARLPAETNWQIGHFTRKIPGGYLETLETGQNRLSDKNLAAYYDKLALVVRGDLFDPNRWVEIWKLNTGQYDDLLAAYPAIFQVDLPGGAETQETQPLWRETDNLVDYAGIQLNLTQPRHAKGLEISLLPPAGAEMTDEAREYQLIYLKAEMPIASQTLEIPEQLPEGGIVRTIEIPAEAVAQGYDTIKIFPARGDRIYHNIYSIRSVRLVE